MESDLDITALSHGELVTFVYQLRQQLEERDQEIIRLKQQLLEEQSQDVQAVQNAQDTQGVAETAGNKETIPAEDAQQPAEDVQQLGSQEDLLSRLEKIYPGEE